MKIFKRAALAVLWIVMSCNLAFGGGPITPSTLWVTEPEEGVTFDTLWVGITADEADEVGTARYRDFYFPESGHKTAAELRFSAIFRPDSVIGVTDSLNSWFQPIYMLPEDSTGNPGVYHKPGARRNRYEYYVSANDSMPMFWQLDWEDLIAPLSKATTDPHQVYSWPNADNYFQLDYPMAGIRWWFRVDQGVDGTARKAVIYPEVIFK